VRKGQEEESGSQRAMQDPEKWRKVTGGKIRSAAAELAESLQQDSQIASIAAEDPWSRSTYRVPKEAPSKVRL
jgi:hypothetical protein